MEQVYSQCYFAVDAVYLTQTNIRPILYMRLILCPSRKTCSCSILCNSPLTKSRISYSVIRIVTCVVCESFTTGRTNVLNPPPNTSSSMALWAVDEAAEPETKHRCFAGCVSMLIKTTLYQSRETSCFCFVSSFVRSTLLA